MTRLPAHSRTRARALAFGAGALIFGASLALHPILLDPAAESLAYRTIALDRIWPLIHWGALLGLTLWTLPLLCDADTAPAARQTLGVGLALWATVLSFEAVALVRLTAVGVPGLWAWTLAVGYLGAAFDGVGLLLIGWHGAALVEASGGVIAAGSLLAYAVPGIALPVLVAAGGGALAATIVALRRWW